MLINTLKYVTFLTLAAAPLRLAAADFSFAGTLAQDDDRRGYTVTIQKGGPVTFQTLSWAGGTTTTGGTELPGGFDPTLSLFDANGNLIGVNRDGGCGTVPPDPINSFCWDASLNLILPAGTYQLVLSESSNVPIGPTLKDGFIYDGAGNFTTPPGISTGSGFWDVTPRQKTASFGLAIKGADTVVSGFTPKVSSLVNAASNVSGPIAANTILTYYDPAVTAAPVSVTVGTLAATVLYSGKGQINFVVPPGLTVGSTQSLQISQGGLLLSSTQQQVAAAVPALFTDDQSGSGQAAIRNLDFSLNGPTNPTKGGSYAIVYGTGFGEVLAPGANGLQLLASGVTASVGGKSAEVTYAGLVPGSTPGLQQFNVLLPQDVPTGSAVSITLTIGGSSTQTGATVAIGQ